MAEGTEGAVSCPSRGYRPIEEYAAVGDCHGGALVAGDGDVDWCSLERFDADPIFCRLLDSTKGGHLSVRLTGKTGFSRRYVGDTNVLRTELTCATGTIALLDFMPVGRCPDAGLHDYVTLDAPGWFVRRIEVIEGEVDLAVVIAPSTAFASKPTALGRRGTHIQVQEGPGIFLRMAAGQCPGNLQIGYSIDLESDGDERVLKHLEGWRGSRPVQAGNIAFGQTQTDLYGHIVEGTLVYRTLGGSGKDDDHRLYEALIDEVAVLWDRPDQGIWELRGAPRHYVHSKAMCWAALDRAIKLIGTSPEREALRDRILASIVKDGTGRDGACFRQSYESDDVDGALLLLPMLGLPLDPSLLASTIDTVSRRLGRGDLVYRLPAADQGCDEGAFVACSFWLVDALLALGRGDEARDLFERMAARANDVGLFAEEIDVETGAFLGNVPQALSHIGLVISAVNLALFEKGGAEAVSGTYADRAERYVGSTIGMLAVLRAVVSDPSMLKILNSRDSMFEIGREIKPGNREGVHRHA